MIEEARAKRNGAPGAGLRRQLKLGACAAMLAVTGGASASGCTSSYGMYTDASSNTILGYVDTATGLVLQTVNLGAGNGNATAVNPQSGLIYYIDRSTSAMKTFNPTTNAVSTLVTNVGAWGQNAVGAAIDNNGTYWVLDNTYQLRSFDSSGNALSTVGINLPTTDASGTRIRKNLDTTTGNPLTSGDLYFGADGALYAILNTQQTDNLGNVTRNTTSLASLGFTSSFGASVTAAAPRPLTYGGTYYGNSTQAVNGVIYDVVSGKVMVTDFNQKIGTLNTSTGAVTFQTGSSSFPFTDMGSCTVAPSQPTFSKTFGASTLNVGNTTTLTITLSNANVSPYYTTSSLTDALPSGLVIANPSSASTTCLMADGSASVLTATAGSGSVSLPSGLEIPGNGSCSISVSVLATSGGTKANTIAASSLTTTAGNPPSDAAATLTVPVPLAPSMSKAFNPTTVTVGQATLLTITLQNPNAYALPLNQSLIDTLPSGSVVASTPGASTTCTLGSGSFNAAAGAGSISLSSGASIPAGGCTIRVNVSANAAGTYNNSIPATSLMAGGQASTSAASASFSAAGSPMTMQKSMSPANATAGTSISLTITLNNPNASAVPLGSVTDNLPSGLVAASNSGTTTCSGGVVSSTVGGSSVGMQGGSVPANGSCSMTISVRGNGSVIGTITNTINPSDVVAGAAGPVSAASASVTITAPPSGTVSMQKSFSPSSISVGGTSTLTIQLSNLMANRFNSSTSLVDNLPTGLSVVAGSGSTSGCGTGILTASGSTITLASYTILRNSTCTITVSVAATTAGLKSNSIPASSFSGTNNLTTAPVAATNPASADLLVYGALNGSFSKLQRLYPSGALTGAAISAAPGTLIEYCISAKQIDGINPATNSVIRDPLPMQETFQSNSYGPGQDMKLSYDNGATWTYLTAAVDGDGGRYATGAGSFTQGGNTINYTNGLVSANLTQMSYGKTATLCFVAKIK